MQISSQNLSKVETAKIQSQFVQLLADLGHSDATTFFEDFFSETEKVVLAKRLAIAILLHKGKPYGEIAKSLNVSSATISAVAEMLIKPGIVTALQKIQEDEWAEKWASKVSRMFGARV